jgi:hypothetical protein
MRTGDVALVAPGVVGAFPAMTGSGRPSRRLRAVRGRPTLGEAAAVFLAQPDLAASSRRSYAQTLAGCGRRSARAAWSTGSAAGSSSAPSGMRGARRRRRPGTATSPRCGRSRASARGTAGQTPGSPTGCHAGASRRTATRAIPYAQLDRLWRRDDVAAREKALWRLLYETGARAQEVLSLDIDDLDLENRAEELFSAASGGWTLHQLRHSALTHLAEEDVSLPLLMAKSRHTSLRSLQRYARPGPEAVAKLTADHDPERRRR